MVLVKSSLPLLAFRIFSETEAELPFLRRWRGIGPALGNSTGGGGGFDWRRRIGPSEAVVESRLRGGGFGRRQGLERLALCF